jgi:hypothetical protein
MCFYSTLKKLCHVIKEEEKDEKFRPAFQECQPDGKWK